MKLYLAGGAVRDLLLGRPLIDRDYLVMNATRQEFQEAFPNAWEVGRAFPIFLLEGLEFSFPRGRTVTEELKSRDLTVNALLLDENGDLTCHPQGLDDLHARVLRPASRQSFVDDPLRVFRAARFWAAFPDFTPHEELIDTMRSVADQGLLATIAADRIGQETRKALGALAPGNYLRLLAQSNCLSPWFKEFKESLNIPAGPPQYHDTNVLEHTCRLMDRLAGDPVAVWMGLCHDIGKTVTPWERLPRHHGHDKKGVALAQDLARRIRLSNTYVTAGGKAAQWHMVAARYDELRAGTKVDLLMDIQRVRMIEPLFALVVADQDRNFSDQAAQDLKTILGVTLPREAMNRGAESGKRLRELRASALSKTMK